MKRKKLVKSIPLYLVLTFLAVIIIFPIFYIVISSFKNTEDILASTAFFPKVYIVDNYIRAWKLSNFKTYMWNSLYMCGVIVIGTIATSVMSGYVFSRGQFPGKKVLLLVITSSMFISAGSLFLYPQLQIAKLLHLNTSLWGVIVIYIFGINVTNL